MTKNHSIANKCLSATLALLLIVSIPFNLGCNSSSVAKGSTAAADVLDTAGHILSPVNADLGAGLLQAGADFNLLATLLNQYDKADAANKAGVAGEIQAVLNTVTTNLNDILAAARVKNPEKLEYITTAVAIANGVLQAIFNHIPFSATTAQGVAAARIQSSSLPVIPFTNPKGVKKAWNTKFPEARI